MSPLASWSATSAWTRGSSEISRSTRCPPGASTSILCWTVLEHLHDPRRALDNLVQALAPGGLLVVGFPNLLSLKGLVTKFTPLQMHVWFYKNVLGNQTAGEDDAGPFPTHLRISISPPGLHRYAVRNNLTMLHLRTYEAAMQRRERAGRGIVGVRWRILRAGTIAATLGVIDPAATECWPSCRRAADQGDQVNPAVGRWRAPGRRRGRRGSGPGPPRPPGCR